MTKNDQKDQAGYYHDWMNIQEQELLELNQAIAKKSSGCISDAELSQLVEKIMQHFQDYLEKRTELARVDVSPYYSPPWCNSLEKSLLWIGGCRPSSYIRLIYTLTGINTESQLNKFVQGKCIALGDISEEQLSMVNELQGKTISEETKLTMRLVTLQEDVFDYFIAEIATKSRGNVVKELDEHSIGMAKLLEEADKLRMDTLREIVGILTPSQAVDFLAAKKKLAFCLKMWGNQRDQKHGRY